MCCLNVCACITLRWSPSTSAMQQKTQKKEREEARGSRAPTKERSLPRMDLVLVFKLLHEKVPSYWNPEHLIFTSRVEVTNRLSSYTWICCLWRHTHCPWTHLHCTHPQSPASRQRRCGWMRWPLQGDHRGTFTSHHLMHHTSFSGDFTLLCFFTFCFKSVLGISLLNCCEL